MRSITSGTAGSFRLALLAGAAGFAITAPSASFAQDADDDFEEAAEALGGEEDSNVIIVTASKREQTLQETPISVSVTTGETLENAQIRDVLDLQTVTPSLRVSQLQTASATTFIVRGFGNGDNNFGVEPSVGVFIDGVFRSRSASALNDLSNVQRIEVLNGPQSTLFGKNASAGVISVVTRPPQFEFGGNVEAVYGNFNQVFLKGDITGPITDNVAFSVDGSYQQRDGFGEIVNLDEDINDRNRYSVRGQLLIEPTSDISIRLIGDYNDIDEICCQTSNLVVGPTTQNAITAVGGQAPSDFFSDQNFLNVAPVSQSENYGFSGQVDWNIGALTLTSITSYRELRNITNQDVDFTSADLTTENRDQAVDTFTQEFRIASDFDGPINFLLGGFYFDESITQDSSLSIGDDFRNFAAFQAVGNGQLLPGLTPAQQIGIGEGVLASVDTQLSLPVGSVLGGDFLSLERFTMDNESYSIFGTVDFEPVDGLVFTAGFNYTDDSKDFSITTTAGDPLASFNVIDQFISIATGGAVTTRDQFQALPQAQQDALQALATSAANPLLPLADLQFQTGFLDLPNAVEPGQTNDDEFTYLFRVAYEVIPEINIYGSYATGFKASSVNLSRDSRPSADLFVAGVGPRPAPDGSTNFRGSTFLAPSSPIIDAGLATPNLSNGTRFAGPEEAEVFEIGLKAQFDGFGFNLAVFDQSIQNFQSFIFTGLGFTLLNAGEQSVRGFEFDATVQPTDGLVLTFAMTHLDPVFDDFPNPVLGDLSGQRPGGIPSFAISTSATYTHEWDSGTRLITRVDYNHESNEDINNGLPGFNFALGNTQIFKREVNLVNTSMTLALNNGFEVGAFARNLFDDRFISTVFDGVAQSGTVAGYPSAPRTYGGVVRYRF
ncbi:TonB-dependent receptor [Erythrobacter longus]|uniref:TonB-dependent receptor n=1 Tax=Erythrobacter longus TaxID=1044 RepID=A0A074MB04_ERYLO|nr:TonB-dependent receptor [Erythrobacter longus]KEO91996.1 TonB-dependent receptor [Erythrobacter longus]